MTPTPAHTQRHALDALLADLRRFFTDFLSLYNADYPLVLALWTMATYLWPHFDAFPYLVITSHTKRSGKTRLAELLSFVASNAAMVPDPTAASIFRSITDEHPTLIFDEAEDLSRTNVASLGVVLKTGYRRGQTIRRAANNEQGYVEYDVYCPKVFILIGDVMDTVRDRSIIVRMVRGEPARRFLYEPAKAEGASLGERIAEAVGTDARAAIQRAYETSKGLPFLNDRDEELWLPLFAVCEAMYPALVADLQRIAVDVATEKTAEAERYLNLQGAERDAEADEYAVRLVRDLKVVMGAARGVFTMDAIERLKALPTAPWRKYRGTGLDYMAMADLLAHHLPHTSIGPKQVKLNGKNGRGYRRDDVDRALKAMAAAKDAATPKGAA